jgi:hypothetical protein
LIELTQRLFEGRRTEVNLKASLKDRETRYDRLIRRVIKEGVKSRVLKARSARSAAAPQNRPNGMDI